MNEYLYFLVGVDDLAKTKWLNSWKDTCLKFKSGEYQSAPNFVTYLNKFFGINKNIVIDTDWVFTKKRVDVLKEFKRVKPDATVKLVFFPKPVRVCTLNQREKLNNFYGFYEDFSTGLIDEFIIVGGTVGTEDVRLIPEAFWGFKLNEPHSVKTLGQHIEQTSEYLNRHGANHELITAALYHDVNKPEVKTYKGEDGYPTKWARYPNHANVACYTWYCDNVNFEDSFVHYVGALIQKHGESTDGNEELNDFFIKEGYTFLYDLKLFQEADNYRSFDEKIKIWFKKFFR